MIIYQSDDIFLQKKIKCFITFVTTRTSFGYLQYYDLNYLDFCYQNILT
jgi:hypothetical protein